MEKDIELTTKTETFYGVSQLKKWLKTYSAVLITTISLSQDVATTFQYSEMPSPIAYTVLSQRPDLFPDSEYVITYQELSNEDQEVNYSSLAYAAAFEVPGPRNMIHGDVQGLSNYLHEYFDVYTVTDNRKSNRFINFWIVVPADQRELTSLKASLHKLSNYYAFPDGSGTFNVNNMKIGNGTKITRQA